MTWTLSNLCRNKNPPPDKETVIEVSDTSLYITLTIKNIVTYCMHGHREDLICLLVFQFNLPFILFLIQILPILTYLLIHNQDKEVDYY